MGVYLIRGPSGTNPEPSGPSGRPTGEGLRCFGPILGCHASTQGGEGRVGGGRSTLPAGDVAWPPGLHLALNQPLQVGGGPIHPNRYPLMVKVDTPHSFYSSSLVKVLV
jgi:hypothetical protein